MSIQTMPAIEPQPDFPARDLSQANALILEILLANSMHLELEHASAEQLVWTYKVGHAAMHRAIGNADFAPTIGTAIDHGMATYEAISVLVQHLPESRNFLVVNRNAHALASEFGTNQFLDYAGEARAHFTEELPLATGVIKEASARFLGGMADYAIDGAALAYKFERDAAA